MEGHEKNIGKNMGKTWKNIGKTLLEKRWKNMVLKKDRLRSLWLKCDGISGTNLDALRIHFKVDLINQF